MDYIFEKIERTFLTADAFMNHKSIVGDKVFIAEWNVPTTYILVDIINRKKVLLREFVFPKLFMSNEINTWLSKIYFKGLDDSWKINIENIMIPKYDDYEKWEWTKDIRNRIGYRNKKDFAQSQWLDKNECLRFDGYYEPICSLESSEMFIRPVLFLY